MHIKQIVIHGFKSYRDTTVVEPFDKRHNVVVGRNGSGKSNFFAAIQFVLSDEYSHLRPEQRQALLHEGTGARASSAFVEIIFDNSDSRVPIEKDEVSLRRVIGAKKDQYLLNRKLVPRSEVMNLLESAGFSNSNPYYIVKQGKINQMATAPDSQRLNLLREVAGTRVYDERREESMVLLKDANNKMSKINEFLQTIEEKLSTLREEKEELSEYQKWDRTRRSLEYLIHEKELTDAKKKLEDIENTRKNCGADRHKYVEELNTATENAKAAQKRVKEVRKELTQLKEGRESLAETHQRCIKEKTKLEFTIKDMEDEISGDNRSRQRAEAELTKLNNQIREKEAELAKITPEYEKRKQEEEQLTTELSLKEQKRKELYAKQGRSNQFASKDDRDRWIKEELKSLNKQIRDKQEHLNKLTADLKRDGERKESLKRKIEDQGNKQEEHRKQLDDHNKTIYESKKKTEKLQIERKELWRRETNLAQQLSQLKEDLAREDQMVRGLAGKPTINGRDSIGKVLDNFRRNGGEDAKIADQYYGQVIENFTCDQKYYTAVEVTAGARLYHHIVASDHVGTRILKEFNQLHLPGEVTFLPLNRLIGRRPNYPANDEATPMVTILEFKEKFENVFNYMFARVLICRRLEVATNFAKNTGLDCVTIEGDQVSSRGSLTGGYLNSSRSRLERQRNRNDLLEQIEKTEPELKELKEQLADVEAQINGIVQEMQKTETKSQKLRGICDKYRADVDLAREEIQTIDRYFHSRERAIAQCKTSLEALKTSKESLESELNQELMTQLSVADSKEVEKLNDEIQRLNNDNKKTFSARMKLEADKNKLENLLSNNLCRRREELQHALQEISQEDHRRQLANYRAELEEKNGSIEKIISELNEHNHKIKSSEKKLKSEQENCEKWKTEEKRIEEKIEEDAKMFEKIAAKQNLFEQKISELTEKIKDLGALPSSDSYSSYVNMSIKQLFKELEKANSALKKFSHVNKKALDQFMSFSDQKEKLTKRKEELDRSEEKIRELLSTLESRKLEVIHFTFKQVSTFFSEVFRKLVPTGRATLVMRTGRDDEVVLLDHMTSDSFTGVGIRISFTEGDTEMREMNQLSGGQKSLVALALIFAIQKCDPAPFYLFDEIDQALDGQHRKAVADMIHELSGEAQFITTTFRPELLEHAHKFYGVMFRNKVSHIDCVTREKAKDFVEDDQTHG